VLLVKIYMVPEGDESRAHLLSQATIDLQGTREDGRWYRARLLKAPRFGGPGEGDPVRPHLVPEAQTFRSGWVGGHNPNIRGEWDLLGGALRALLGARLDPYRPVVPAEPPGGQRPPTRGQVERGRREAASRDGCKLEDDPSRQADLFGPRGS
tara:strand:- start:749 stop:1207 length:459 start_codon:yes stop_codon:yes gene_type:complete